MTIDFKTIAQSVRPADPAAARHVTLTVAKRGPMHRVTLHDSAAPDRKEAQAMDHVWKLALLSARDRASPRGIAADAEGAALLAEAIAECDAAIAAPPA